MSSGSGSRQRSRKRSGREEEEQVESGFEFDLPEPQTTSTTTTSRSRKKNDASKPSRPRSSSRSSRSTVKFDKIDEDDDSEVESRPQPTRRRRDSSSNGQRKRSRAKSSIDDEHEDGDAPSVDRRSAVPNHDFCDACGDPGDLLCCDMCPCAFHFLCVDPPIDPSNLPDGDWFCKKCTHVQQKKNPRGLEPGPYAAIFDFVTGLNPRVFSLPYSVKRQPYAERDKSKDSKSMDMMELMKSPEAALLRYVADERNDARKRKGKICSTCGLGDDSETLVNCSTCRKYYHKYCLEPMAILENGWVCPEHDSKHRSKKKQSVVPAPPNVELEREIASSFIKLSFENSYVPLDLDISDDDESTIAQESDEDYKKLSSSSSSGSMNGTSKATQYDPYTNISRLRQNPLGYFGLGSDRTDTRRNQQTVQSNSIPHIPDHGNSYNRPQLFRSPLRQSDASRPTIIPASPYLATNAPRDRLFEWGLTKIHADENLLSTQLSHLNDLLEKLSQPPTTTKELAEIVYSSKKRAEYGIKEVQHGQIVPNIFSSLQASIPDPNQLAQCIALDIAGMSKSSIHSVAYQTEWFSNLLQIMASPRRTDLLAYLGWQRLEQLALQAKLMSTRPASENGAATPSPRQDSNVSTSKTTSHTPSTSFERTHLDFDEEISKSNRKKRLRENAANIEVPLQHNPRKSSKVNENNTNPSTNFEVVISDGEWDDLITEATSHTESQNNRKNANLSSNTQASTVTSSSREPRQNGQNLASNELIEQSQSNMQTASRVQSENERREKERAIQLEKEKERREKERAIQIEKDKQENERIMQLEKQKREQEIQNQLELEKQKLELEKQEKEKQRIAELENQQRLEKENQERIRLQQIETQRELERQEAQKVVQQTEKAIRETIEKIAKQAAKDAMDVDTTAPSSPNNPKSILRVTPVAKVPPAVPVATPTKSSPKLTISLSTWKKSSEGVTPSSDSSAAQVSSSVGISPQPPIQIAPAGVANVSSIETITNSANASAAVSSPSASTTTSSQTTNNSIGPKSPEVTTTDSVSPLLLATPTKPTNTAVSSTPIAAAATPGTSTTAPTVITFKSPRIESSKLAHWVVNRISGVLIGWDSTDKPVYIELKNTTTTIGRDDPNKVDVILSPYTSDATRISQIHAKITKNDQNKWVFESIGRNGVRVNGQTKGKGSPVVLDLQDRDLITFYKLPLMFREVSKITPDM